ncbi:heavy metal-associated isoprenylated plant protein 21-like [Gastrolobium bilobum]|uniref:heavy metal-associated isoprenylated plant protein 21-like n=1 Tax=Gastrolobium bilobum TaxID=150636 RepID=UPI002AB0A0B5|nr:heavy metal-associated isoprenylated plant protein 21-like [Gastrolobium bilobum]
MGALDYLSNFCIIPNTKTKHKAMQTVEIKVKMDCDGCERRVRNAVATMKGVKSVDINRKQSRVTVNGYVDANKVLKRVRRTGKKRAEFWPYVPQHVVSYPHASGVYDKRAPAGYVKNVQTFPASVETEEKFMSLFSEDNVNACSIM